MEEKSESRYGLQEVDNAFCPKCHKSVYLLSHMMICHTEFKRGKPAFYICFDCKFVGEVGVGEVKQTEID